MAFPSEAPFVDHLPLALAERNPGLRPLPWPPWRSGPRALRATWKVAVAWLVCLALALYLGELSVRYQWYNYPAGRWRLGVYPPWTLALLWTLWMGWPYGAVLAGLVALDLGLRAGFGAWSAGIALADPLGLGVCCLFLRGFPLDPRMRRLRDVGLLAAATFFAAVTGSLGAFVVAGGRAMYPAELLHLWEGWWLGHAVEGLLLAAPLAVLAGPAVERWKAQRFECLLQASSFRKQALASAVCGALLILFYTVWLQSAGTPMAGALARGIEDTALRTRLLEAYGAAAARSSAIVATLLGMAGVGVWVSLALRRRLADQAEAETQRCALEARRRDLLQALWQAQTGAAGEGLDVGKTAARWAEHLARIPEIGAASIYLRASRAPGGLELAGHAEAGAAAAPAALPVQLPSEGHLCSQALLEGRALSASVGGPRGSLLEGHAPYLRQSGLDEVLAVPLAGERETLGALLLFSGQAFGAEEEDQYLYGGLGRAAGAALERAASQAQTRRQAEQLGGLYQLAQDLAAEHEPGELMRRVTEAACSLLGAECAAAVLKEKGTGSEPGWVVAWVAAQPGVAAPQPGRRVEAGGSGLVAACVREGRVQFAGMQAPSTEEVRLLPEWNAAMACVVPLALEEQEVEGALALTFPAAGPSGGLETGLAEELARQACAGLRRVRLLEETRRQAAEIALFDQIGRAMSERLHITDTLKRIVESVSQVFPAEWATVLEHEAATGELVTRATTIPHPEAAGVRLSLASPSLATACFLEGRTIVSADAARDARSSPELRAKFGTGSAVAVPLGPAQARIGAILALSGVPRTFAVDEVRRLEQIAALASSAWERARLYEELQRRAGELRSSEARLQEIVDGLPALVVGLDLAGRVVSFNAAAEAATGYRRDEVLGRDGFELLLAEPEERRRVRELFSAIAAGNGRGREMVTSLAPRAGKPRRVRWSAEPLRASDGRPNGVVGMGLDVTDQIQLEAQLLQAQKMESVGALAGGMAHDFNNLLGGILGQTALVRTQLPPGHPAQQALVKIAGAAQRGADLTGKLLVFARKSVLQPAPVDLGALLRETADLLAASFPREIVLRLFVAPGLPTILGDATQLQQVLLNLCVNARDAMPQGGELTLRAEPAGDLSVRLEVRDTGCGMNEEVKAHLFEPFFTTKEPGKGTGLGLAVVFGIVRSHGGRVEVESQAGRGTHFRLWLPVRPPEEAPGGAGEERVERVERDAERERSVPGEALTGQEEILLVDDETIMRETTQELLANLGYRVRTAPGGTEALRLLDAQAARPDLVVLDVVMPGLARLPLFQELRRRLPGVPVLLISGYSRDAAVQELLDAGALELIQKPFRIEELAGAIRRALAERKRKN